MTFSETEAKTLVEQYGIPTIAGREAGTAEQAAEVARTLGFPVVLKVSHPEIAHKSDVGGVRLGLTNADQARRAAQDLLQRFAGAKVRVEAQASEEGVDLILGFSRDPVFGAVTMVGLGGIYAELLGDTRLQVGPVTQEDARAMIEGLKGRGILQGARGRAPVDLEALARAISAVSTIALEHPEIRELDINPWRAMPQGGVALDALVLESTPAPASGPVRAQTVPPAERVGPLFAPRAVAVVGASSSGRRAGNVILDNLKTYGFSGAIYPVNPSRKEIQGLPSYARLCDCPGPVDLCVLALPYQQVEGVMQDVAAAGVQHVILVSGGFSDAGLPGKELEQKLVAFCRQHDIALMGPNSIGTLDTTSGFCTSIGTLPPMKKSGVSVLGQSGTLSTGFALEEITRYRRGFAKVACLGNKADVNECDFLEYLADDPETRAIGMYIESVSDGQRFLRAARRAAQSKPVVVLKSGRTETGARAAASHTGALAGSDAVYDTAFLQSGLQRASDLGEFFGVLRTFDLCPLPAGNRIGVVSITGLGCVLSADACGLSGMQLAQIAPETQQRLQALVPPWAPIGNPADIWSTIEQRGPLAAYQQMCEIMLSDQQVDILILVLVLLDEGMFDPAEALRPLREAYPQKPILACHLGGRQAHLERFEQELEPLGVPFFRGPEAAIKSAAFLDQRRQILERLATAAH